ncbi:ZN638 protein, partial [Upupa epops]|nr:ZN638 protein [Upupa epops]
STGLKNYPEGSGVVQTAAANRPVEPSVSKNGAIPIPCGKDKMSAGHVEPSESHLGREARELVVRPAQTSVEKADAGLGGAIVSAVKSADPELSEEMLPLPSSLEREEAAQDGAEPMSVESAVGSALEKGIKEKELAAPTAQLPEEVDHTGEAEGAPADPEVKLAAEDSMGVVPKALPSDPGAVPVEVVLCGVAQPRDQLDAPENSPLSDAVKTKCETVAASITEKETVLAVENKLSVAGEMKPEELVFKVRRALEENPEKLVGKTGAATEKKLEQSVAKTEAAVEKAAGAVGESNEESSSKAYQSKGEEAAKADEIPGAVALNTSLPVKEYPSVGKTMLKAVVSLMDISRVPAWKNEPALCKIGEQKSPLKPETQDQATMEKTPASKEEASLQPGSSPSSPGDGSSQDQVSRSGGGDGKGGNGRNSPPQEKDWQVETRASSKQAQEGESRAPSAKKDTGGTKVRRAGRPVPCARSVTNSRLLSDEEELFPFNLDEFVTVDEVVEEVESPVKMRRNPPRGKRKEGAKANSSCEPSSKRRKGKSSMAHMAESELSFVTLDEIGDDEEATTQLMGVAGLEVLSDPQGLVVVDEVMEEEETSSELVKDLKLLVPSNSPCKREDLGSHKDILRSGFEEQDLKAEPLVTVDEIGEVEELPLNEPADLNMKNGLGCKDQEKAAADDPGDSASSQVPDDPSALVTVDEIQEDNEDNPLVTLDEVNEDEDDFLADFSRLKEDLNFVTVDEVGEEDEEEENSVPGKIVTESEDGNDIVALAGPEETEILEDLSPGEEMAEAPEAKGKNCLLFLEGKEKIRGLSSQRSWLQKQSVWKLLVLSRRSNIVFCLNVSLCSPGDQLGSGDKEPESQQKKAAPSGVLKPQTTPKDLDYLIPKAGFFCQICSLFYADETSVKNHCKTPLHQQNM